MRVARQSVMVVFGGIALLLSVAAFGQDWPQWRGANRDARATGFQAPATWPDQLTQKWKVTVGEGVASPSLVGDKLYVFARQDGNEILRCLNASSGDEVWRDQHEAESIRGPASSFDGPRSSPTVAEGKVVTLGAQGMLSCHDAESGELVWRNDENVGNVPRFATSSSPIVVASLAITEFGEDRDGGLAAYDLATGEEAWKWTGSGAAYGSPTVITIDGVEAIVSPMSDKLVAIAAADGQVLWEMSYRQGRYNSASPIVAGGRLILAGPESGMTALELAKVGDEVDSKEVWRNTDNSVGFNTPVVKGDRLYGISRLNSLFCIDVGTGDSVWNAPLGEDAEAQSQQRQANRDEGDDDSGRRRRRGRRGGRGGGGYGSVVDANNVLLALIPTGQLTVFAPGDEFSQLSTYKVAESGAYAYPVPTKLGLFIKDQDSVALWAMQD